MLREIYLVKRIRFVIGSEVSDAQILGERFYRENKLKAKVLGNVEFVASLILHSVIPATVASTVSKQLVQNFKKVMAIKPLITLWKKLLDSPGINEYIGTVVSTLKSFLLVRTFPLKRCLCANWLDYYIEKQRERVHLKSRLLFFFQDARKVADEEGFVAVETKKRSGKHK
ncbi:hypothetical protein GEMRC1_006644 [Eukaryota sp. GEM-RC1]